MAKSNQGNQESRVFVTHSVDFDSDGSPDMFITREISSDEAAAMGAGFLICLGIGALALVAYGMCHAIMYYMDLASAWTRNTWLIIATLTYFVVSTIIFGIYLGGVVKAFFVSILTIAIPAGLYYFAIWVMSWSGGVWVILIGACCLAAVGSWLYVALQNES